MNDRKRDPSLYVFLLGRWMSPNHRVLRAKDGKVERLYRIWLYRL